MESISIFDIIKIGIGPSSSHTMGPWNAANMFLDLIEKNQGIEQVKEVFVEFFGSLAKTGIGHGTDIAGMLGLAGYNFRTIDTSQIDIITDEIKRSQILKLGGKKELKFIYGHHLVLNKKETLPFHPNGMIFKAIFDDDSEISQDYYSIGGGFVSIKDDVQVADKLKPSFYPCHKGADVLRYCEKLNLSVSDLVYKNEESWRTRNEINSKALEIWESITDAIYRGVNKSGILPGGLNVVRRATNLNTKLLKGNIYHNKGEWFELVKESEGSFEHINKWVSCFAIAVNEENASFGRIVTAPTNGASGIIPAVLMYSQTFTIHVGNDKIIRFLLTAGEIGTLFKKKCNYISCNGRMSGRNRRLISYGSSRTNRDNGWNSGTGLNGRRNSHGASFGLNL